MIIKVVWHAVSFIDVVLRVGEDFREGEDGIGPLEFRSKRRRFSQVRGRWAEGVCTVEGAGEEGGEDSWIGKNILQK